MEFPWQIDCKMDTFMSFEKISATHRLSNGYGISLMNTANDPIRPHQMVRRLNIESAGI